MANSIQRYRGYRYTVEYWRLALGSDIHVVAWNKKGEVYVGNSIPEMRAAIDALIAK